MMRLQPESTGGALSMISLLATGLNPNVTIKIETLPVKLDGEGRHFGAVA